MKQELREITVEEANAILETNGKHNRKVDINLVEEIKNDILNDSFDIDNTFVVLKGGRLYYGQHTLRAIIEAETPLRLNVVEVEKNDGFHPAGMLNLKSKYKYNNKIVNGE